MCYIFLKLFGGTLVNGELRTREVDDPHWRLLLFIFNGYEGIINWNGQMSLKEILNYSVNDNLVDRLLSVP